LKVYIDTYCTTTGVSRFGEEYPTWKYVKTENLTDFTSFTYVLTENSTLPGFSPIAIVNGFSGYKLIPFPPTIVLKPKVWVMKKLT